MHFRGSFFQVEHKQCIMLGRLFQLKQKTIPTYSNMNNKQYIVKGVNITIYSAKAKVVWHAKCLYAWLMCQYTDAPCILWHDHLESNRPSPLSMPILTLWGF